MRKLVRRFAALLAGLAALTADSLVPAALTAAGFALVAAGLLTYLAPVAAAPDVTPTPQAASSSPSASTRLTLPPPAPSASIDITKRIPTRVVIAAMSIDLSVVPPPPHETFPLCGVAEYSPDFSRPGQKGVTFIYAHARTGMFLPLLTQSIRDANSMLHMLVVLYTDDDLMFTYEVTQVIRHHTPSNLNDAFAVQTEQLWLQTSEGPLRESTKLEVVATPIGPPLPADHTAAHPTYKGAVCPDAASH